MGCRLNQIVLCNKNDIKQIEKLESTISKLKSMPDGSRELLWELQREGTATSYCNERLMWLGRQLQKRGIEVLWQEA